MSNKDGNGQARGLHGVALQRLRVRQSDEQLHKKPGCEPVGYFGPGLTINLRQAHATVEAGRTVGK